MPHAAQTKAEAARNPPDEVSPPPQTQWYRLPPAGDGCIICDTAIV